METHAQKTNTIGPMAQRIVTTYIDDLTGQTLSEEDRTVVTVALNGKSWTLDVSPESLSTITDTIEKWTANAQSATTSPSRARTSTGTAADRRAQLKAIREWARAQGMAVNERGRISAEVEAAFNAAHS